MDQNANWYDVRPWPRPHCVRWGSSSPERGTHPNFRPMSIVAKRSPIRSTAEHLSKPGFQCLVWATVCTRTQRSAVSIQPFGHNRNWTKSGSYFFETGWGSWYPSNTMWPGPRPTSISSGILIHPAVWPQQTRKQNGVCARLREGELGPRRTQYGQGRGLPPCEVSSRSTQPFGHNRHGPRII